MNMDKNKILDNWDQYSVEDLAGFIRQGIVTLDELCQEGLVVDMRHKLKSYF